MMGMENIDILSIISDILLLVFNFVVYCMVVPLKKDTAGTRIALCIGELLIITGYLWMALGEVIDSEFAMFFWMTLPSYLLFLIFAKHKKFRFLFLMCVTDIMTIIIGFLASMTGGLFVGINADLTHIVEFVVMVVILWIGHPYLIKLRNLIGSVDSDWMGVAFSTLGFYAVLVIMAIYPSPLAYRKEYILPYFVLCVVIVQVYYVVIKSVMKTQTINIQNEKLKAQNQLYEMAYHDPLTGIGNRAAFGVLGEKIGNKTLNFDTICCVMMDINNLKLINDKYGHDAGDKSILCMKDALRKAFSGKRAHFFRMGGDEFCVMCLDIDETGILKILDEFSKYVENERPYKEMSVAAGYEFWRNEGDTPVSKMLLEADKKMYEKKKSMKLYNNNGTPYGKPNSGRDAYNNDFN